MTATEAKPDDEDATLKAVRKWLADQGYPLEMRVARQFQTAGYDVQQSEFYPTTEGKAREIDVCARLGETWNIDAAAPPAKDETR